MRLCVCVCVCVCVCLQEENGSSSDGEVKTNGMENGGTENGIESHDQQNGKCVNGLYKVRLILMW